MVAAMRKQSTPSNQPAAAKYPGRKIDAIRTAAPTSGSAVAMGLVCVGVMGKFLSMGPVMRDPGQR